MVWPLNTLSRPGFNFSTLNTAPLINVPERHPNVHMLSGLCSGLSLSPCQWTYCSCADGNPACILLPLKLVVARFLDIDVASSPADPLFGTLFLNLLYLPESWRGWGNRLFKRTCYFSRTKGNSFQMWKLICQNVITVITYTEKQLQVCCHAK